MNLRAPVSLRELLARHPDMFYKQEWYLDEAFMDIALTPVPRMFSRLIPSKTADAVLPIDERTDTVLLAELYTRFPDDPRWMKWMWTADTDRHGHDVWVGAPLGKGFEIHRRFEIDHQWTTPMWD